MDKDLKAALHIAGSAGLMVIVLGAADFIHGLVSAPAGTVKLRVGGLLVGLLMLFGGLRILAVVRWLSLLAAAALLLEPLLSAVVVPAGLTLVQIRLYPSAFFASYIPWAFSVAVALVGAVRLSDPRLLAARERIGRTVHSARIPLVLGLVFAVGAACFEYRVLGGEAAQRASRAVAEKLGPGYRYFTVSLDKTLGTPAKYSATVQAWNERELRTIPVRWKE
jgi:hypothetical protein